ncbi:Cysteine-rich protein 1 [Collichthys lucidus]|uniref:Cysteine-rich protein 1 n=1 Tax=Collichthys lucidus TaxID=240159 RepID=A0A4U5VFF7_COLLU|nr:Cysteine-rich protein 1 [Collichthys lucidus]
MRARDEPGAERRPVMRDTARLPGWLGEISFHREAERVTSLGKDWHRPCLKCEKCKKTLSAGSHAEHDGKPYCHRPCYGALFGPGGFGHGGTESHKY